MVAVISVRRPGHEMELQFEATLERRQPLDDVAADVREALNSQPSCALREALGDRPGRATHNIMSGLARHCRSGGGATRTARSWRTAIPTAQGQAYRATSDSEPLVQSRAGTPKLRVLNRNAPTTSSSSRWDRSRTERRCFTCAWWSPRHYITRVHYTRPCSGAPAWPWSRVIGAHLPHLPVFGLRLPAAGPAAAASSIWWPAANTNPTKPLTPKRRHRRGSIMASKVSLLGERLRGAQYEVSDLRGNIDRLLQDLEDAVLIFNRERRLVFASGRSSSSWAGMRADLSGQSIADDFSARHQAGIADRAGRRKPARPIRNRRIPLIGRRRWLGRGRGAALGGSAGRLPAGARLGPAGAPARSRSRSARSAANCRPPTGWRPSAASPAAWRTR